ncbi:MAG: hypothetical protein JJ902_07400 [Roseibium sp.]|nr:hypothetical protein [Roseibium sp.]
MDRMNERAQLMGRMLETIGAMDALPEGYSGGADLRQAAERCMTCDQPESCKKWLESHPDGAAAPMETCPNANLFKLFLTGRAAGMKDS